MLTKRLAFLVALCFGLQTSHAQELSLKEKAAQLKDVKDVPYLCQDSIGEGPFNLGCGDSKFWAVVLHKEEAIPYLLDMLDDDTETKAPVANSMNLYTVGDIALKALQEIIKDIPVYELMGIELDPVCGKCAYWNHLADLENREAFQASMKKWYKENKDDMVWVASGDVLTCKCTYTHPNLGHFVIDEYVQTTK